MGSVFGRCLLFNNLRPPSFAIILIGKRERIALLELSSLCLCLVSLPHGALGWSAVCNCGISTMYSLFSYTRNLSESNPNPYHCS